MSSHEMISRFSDLTYAEQAAWVQAVGTLVAIAIAIAVPVGLDLLRKRMADREKEERARALTLSILPDLYKLRATTRHFLSEHSGASRSDEIREIDELRGDYFSHAGAFQQILVATPDLAANGARLSGLVYLLFKARETLAAVSRLQAGGYHAAYVNNVDEFVRYATEIDATAESLIRVVESSHGVQQ